MTISRKLLLLLTVSVGLVMFIASLLSLRQYEIALQTALREDLHAHAVTLQIALEEDYANSRTAEAQRLIDRLRENTEIYSVLLFDENQNLIAQSQPLANVILRNPPELPEVLRQNKQSDAIRNINGEKFASVILPMQTNGKVIGAVELVKPLSLIETDIFYARFYWLLTTLLLWLVIGLIVFYVLKRNLSVPINALLKASEAVGKGDFAQKVEITSRRDELGILAAQFNQMAESLDEQNRAAREETENRLRLERELRHNEQLVLVGRLAAGVAHELGAPLNVIDARAEQIQTKPDITPEKCARNLEIIRSNVARITHLIRQLLNLARPFNLNLTEVNLRESIESALEQIEQNAEASKISIDFSDGEDFILIADPNYLLQVWLNIFVNALQEMPDGGSLSIRTFISENKFVVTEIKDTGNGIPDENFVYLFDPFFTTKDIGKGTGLGLPIANRIVEEHGGKIKAGNNENGGALFAVYLPI
jgi:two-component system, NtrC family, sensor kinase